MKKIGQWLKDSKRLKHLFWVLVSVLVQVICIALNTSVLVCAI